jgi:hypothetical protein
METLDQWLANFPEGAVRERLAELEAEQRRLQGMLDLFARKSAAVSGFAGAAPPQEDEGKPKNKVVTPYHASTREAIKALLNEDPRKKWRLADLKRELVERGWLLPGSRGAVDAVLPKIIKEGSIKKTGLGVYRGVMNGASAEPAGQQSLGSPMTSQEEVRLPAD